MQFVFPVVGIFPVYSKKERQWDESSNPLFLCFYFLCFFFFLSSPVCVHRDVGVCTSVVKAEGKNCVFFHTTLSCCLHTSLGQFSHSVYHMYDSM
eukprot:NODE_1341_length_558_cov_34.076621_g1266_i0.p1 GENE.NODE_1341_length_558_cov_34.076621_g1266_i0~~NODE_1341_length_558_cov_34.076621_g1266_i0.p1  ORF type:complete len:95 (+),score=19.79 NODE_1341_length_558_cov_34.076621_g1266_i0:120-404(+)